MTHPGFDEFAASDPNAWPEDRVTVALRAAPKPRVQVPNNPEMARALTRSIESGRLNAREIEIAQKMREYFQPSLDDAGYRAATDAVVRGEPDAARGYIERHR